MERFLELIQSSYKLKLQALYFPLKGGFGKHLLVTPAFQAPETAANDWEWKMAMNTLSLHCSSRQWCIQCRNLLHWSLDNFWLSLFCHCVFRALNAQEKGSRESCWRSARWNQPLWWMIEIRSDLEAHTARSLGFRELLKLQMVLFTCLGCLGYLLCFGLFVLAFSQHFICCQ